MTELIKGLPQVRDGLTLFAFLSLVLLIAFKTKKVPELAFGLLRDKLTRQQFAALLHRVLVLGFAAFVVSVTLAVVAQVLTQKTKPGTLTIDDLRHELTTVSASEEQKVHAESQYMLAMQKIGQGELTNAIAALQESIKAVPSLTAQEMLTYLYRQQHDPAKAAQAWEAAVKTARQHNDKLALARLDNFGFPKSLPEAVGEHDLIGASEPLPAGGARYESATPIRPGLFECTAKNGCFGQFYGIELTPGQRLVIRLRRSPNGGLAGGGIYGTNGDPVAWAGDGFDAMRGNAGPAGAIYEMSYAAGAKGTYFFRTSCDPGTVFRIRIDN
jgi:hypothetical protein